ncbi:putative zinc-finger of transcription factor IIIC complex-domain-containing protein [Dichomitus squalens]|uniref:Putative zinc-finger of transcription factor IIIC complex-domain-containing protein n=1 Tax=Dichomitus squalens TaxID=114155 RepID=A0A4Q9MVA2_9APHY|nr:putative zinc-finger of transcription factor IIIC complex-domain-containing protein [Dichomitus squalens]
MAELPLPTVLGLPAVSVSPSVQGLQFSQDGQAVLLTKYAVYILTPDLGVNVHSSVIKKITDIKPSPRGIVRPLGWLRTMIEYDRSLPHQWPIDCSEWGTVSLGSLDPSLWAATLSPSNLTMDAGCVLALLNSNLELTIWSASKNLLTGEWVMLEDVTSSLKIVAVAKTQGSAFKQMLQLQSTCIEWSSQPSWGLTPAPRVDASLLAVGNRAGSVTFLRYNRTNRRMVVVEEVSVSDRWVTQLAWSSWSLIQDDTCEAMLACGTSDGSVTILTARQTLTAKPGITQFVQTHQLHLSVEPYDGEACESDRRAITAMRWANVAERSPILIYHKAGVLFLWSPSFGKAAWSGSRTLLLRTQKRSVGSTALSPCSGISYIPTHDVCVVSLSDGSFHAIRNLFVDPSLDQSSSANVSSETLSAASRAIFVRAEPEKASFKDVDRTNGMTTFDGRATFLWIYEASRPTDFSYKHDAKHISTFVVAQQWEESFGDGVISDLAERVGHPSNSSGETPLSALRAILWQLRESVRIPRIHSGILKVLYQIPLSGALADFHIPPYAGDWTSDVSREVRESLTTHLFGWDSTQSLRMRYAVAVFCQNHSEMPDVQQEFAKAASLFLAGVRNHVQATLIRHISALSELLNQDDISFAHRTIHQAATAGAPPTLAKEAEELRKQLLRSTPHPELSTDASTGTGARTLSSLDSLVEPCPACNVPIPLSPADPESAICANGHVWARCCITSYLLATPTVRTCIGCSRKAFQPSLTLASPAVNMHAAEPTDGDSHGDRGRDKTAPSPQDTGSSAVGGVGGSSSVLPNSARNSRVVRDLLDATRRCPVCGNNFVVLV